VTGCCYARVELGCGAFGFVHTGSTPEIEDEYISCQEARFEKNFKIQHSTLSKLGKLQGSTTGSLEF
jgi:hypothetical protein